MTGTRSEWVAPTTFWRLTRHHGEHDHHHGELDAPDRPTRYEEGGVYDHKPRPPQSSGFRSRRLRPGQPEVTCPGCGARFVGTAPRTTPEENLRFHRDPAWGRCDLTRPEATR